MNTIFFQSKVARMFLSNSFFAFFNLLLIFFSYYFLKLSDFSYLTGLFILEGLLIFFDLTIYNYVISKLSKLKRNYQKLKLFLFFFKKILIFSLIFLLVSLIFIKPFYWDKIVKDQIYIFYNINLSTYLSFITAVIVILRILINYLKVIFIGSFRQELLANIQIGSTLIKILILIFFLLFSRTIESILFSYFFGLVIEFLIFIFFLSNIIKFRFNVNININPPKFANSLIFFSLSIIFLFNIDRVFLSYNSTLNEIGQYNFFKVILSGFFILSASYYSILLPDISKSYRINKITQNIIYTNFKSLNIILIFIISSIFLFTDIIIDDFKISKFLEIGKLSIFKILVIQTYFNIIGIILYSFQISYFFIKIPTLVNFFLLIISIPFFVFFNKPENATDIAIIYLFLNIGWVFINLFFLNKYFKKIFSNKLIIFFFKSSLKNFLIIISLTLVLHFLLYNLSKLLFYLTLFFCFLFFFKKSQQILNKNIKIYF
jgi:O-antigen/teichoic acid export membrane protein